MCEPLKRKLYAYRQEALTSCSRLAVSRFMDRHSLFVDCLAEIRVPDLHFGDDIDAPPQQAFKHPGEAHEALRHATLVAAEVDDEVDIAGCRIEPVGGRRAEHLELANTVLASQGNDGDLVIGNEADHGGTLRNPVRANPIRVHYAPFPLTPS